MDIVLKQNDTAPALVAVIRDAQGAIIDLTGCVVTFTMVNEYGTVVVDAPANVVSGTQGKVEYNWATGNTAIAGQYRGEFKVTLQTGKRLSAPNADYLNIGIFKEL